MNEDSLESNDFITSLVILLDSLPSSCLIKPGCFLSETALTNNLCKLDGKLFSKTFKPRRSAWPIKSSREETSNMVK